MLSHGLQAMTKRGRLEVGVQKGTDVITVNQREEHISCKSNKNEFLCTERCDINGCVKMPCGFLEVMFGYDIPFTCQPFGSEAVSQK